MNDDDAWLKDIESGDSGRDGLERVRRVLTNREKVDPRPMPPQSAYEADAAPPAPHKRPATPVATFHAVSAFEGFDIPQRQWLVPGMIPIGEVTLLSGAGGVGKSLIAAHLAASTCLGSTWMGHQVAGGGALYLSAEDDKNEILRRLASIAASEDVTFADLDRLTFTSVKGGDAILTTFDRSSRMRPTPLLRQVEEFIDVQRPALVVFDTLANLYPGNENDRALVTRFVGVLGGIAMRFECAVLLLSHPSADGLRTGSGTSGSTAWEAACRSRLYFERVKSDEFEGDVDARILSHKKSNYSRADTEITVRWSDGVFRPDQVEGSLDRQAAGARAERVFMKLLRLFTEQGRRVSHRHGPSYAPKEFADHPDSEGVTKRALQQGMERLLSASRIAVEESGPPSKRVLYLREVTE